MRKCDLFVVGASNYDIEKKVHEDRTADECDDGEVRFYILI